MSAPASTGLLSEIEQAVASVGLDASMRTGASDGRELLTVDGHRLDLDVVERAHPNPADLRSLVEGTAGPAIVVADRISDAGRGVLRSHGWSWLDRRGHLRLWQPGLRVEVPFESSAPRERPHTGNLWTPVGLEIALHALIHPEREAAARDIARTIGRSVGATHEMLARFADAGLIGPSTRRPLLPDLFWETTAHWPDDGWLALGAPIEEVAERLPAVELVRVDERAATLGGARIAAAGDLPARCYVRSAASLRRLRSLVAKDAPTRTFVRLAPVSWLPELDEYEPTPEHPWFIAHPMVCAVRLAADLSRGREIVEAWGVIPGESEVTA